MRTKILLAVAAFLVAGTVLVTIGIGHHPADGLAVVGLLASCSPWTLRWITGGY